MEPFPSKEKERVGYSLPIQRFQRDQVSRSGEIQGSRSGGNTFDKFRRKFRGRSSVIESRVRLNATNFNAPRRSNGLFTRESKTEGEQKVRGKGIVRFVCNLFPPVHLSIDRINNSLSLSRYFLPFYLERRHDNRFPSVMNVPVREFMQIFAPFRSNMSAILSRLSNGGQKRV